MNTIKKVYVFGSISRMIYFFKNIESSGMRMQINMLLSHQFPDIFPQDRSITIFGHLSNLVNRNDILDTDVMTFIKCDNVNNVVAFAHIVREREPRKFR